MSNLVDCHTSSCKWLAACSRCCRKCNFRVCGWDRGNRSRKFGASAPCSGSFEAVRALKFDRLAQQVLAMVSQHMVARAFRRGYQKCSERKILGSSLERERRICKIQILGKGFIRKEEKFLFWSNLRSVTRLFYRLLNANIEKITLNIFLLLGWHINGILMSCLVWSLFNHDRLLNGDVVVLRAIAGFAMINVMNVLRLGFLEDPFMALEI